MSAHSYDLKPGLDNLPKPHQSAFPHPHVFGTYEEGDRIATGGMTLRAYMATKFAASFIVTLPNASDRNDPEIFMSTARASIRFADALIEELAK